MNIAIIGAGNIGGHLARQFSRAGHDVTIAFSQTEERLQNRAAEIGVAVKTGSIAQAVSGNTVIVLSVLWADIDAVLKQAGDLSGKIIIDATNPYGPDGLINLDMPAAEHNLKRMPGAQLIRSFNMFTAGFQIEVAQGQHRPVAMFFAATSGEAQKIAVQLVAATGFEPVSLGGLEHVSAIETPTGILLGKSFRPEDAQQIAQALLQNDMTLTKQLAEEKKA